MGSVTALSGTAAFTIATAATPHSGSIPTSGPAGYSSSGMGGGGGRGGFGGGTRPTGGVSGGAGAVGGGGAGGTSSSSDLTALLEATDTTWSAAVIGSQSAAGYELSTDTAVMAIGGFSGSDPSPTLAAFQQDVAEGRISYFIAGGGMGGGGSGAGSEISAWVQANFTAVTVGNATVYDLTASGTG